MSGPRVTVAITLDGERVELYPGFMRTLRARAANEAIIERAELATRNLDRPTPGWTEHAACIGLPTSLMYPPPGRGTADDALRMCRTRCPVSLSCLRAAARNEHHEHPSFIFGVRGGLTAQHRGIAYMRARKGGGYLNVTGQTA